MSKYKISLVASAIRPHVWQSFFNSLKGNKYSIEVVFVGDVRPNFPLPPFVKYIYATVKPAQCYEIGFRAATGELVGWTADDATYDHSQPNNLDIIYDFYKSFNNKNIVVGQRPIEDHRDVFRNHYFFGKHPETPYMLPFGFMDRELFHELGGYDKRFVCGQSENDMVMRVFAKGNGICSKEYLCMNSYVWVDHTHIHDWQHTAKVGFRHHYPQDREILENAWVKQGYGHFKRTKHVGDISKTRLLPFEPFEDKNLLTVSQEPKGEW